MHVLLIYNLLDYQYLVKDELTTMGSRHSGSHRFGLIDVRERKPSFPQTKVTREELPILAALPTGASALVLSPWTSVDSHSLLGH